MSQNDDTNKQRRYSAVPSNLSKSQRSLQHLQNSSVKSKENKVFTVFKQIVNRKSREIDLEEEQKKFLSAEPTPSKLDNDHLNDSEIFGEADQTIFGANSTRVTDYLDTIPITPQEDHHHKFFSFLAVFFFDVDFR